MIYTHVIDGIRDKLNYFLSNGQFITITREDAIGLLKEIDIIIALANKNGAEISIGKKA